MSEPESASWEEPLVTSSVAVADAENERETLAWAMLHGNPMLRGWTVTDVSFYTTELLEYALVEMVRGLQADVLHVSAAISYTLVVLTGTMLARGRAVGREGVVRMLIAAGIMIAPQLGPGVFILVFQPDHIGTQAPLLLTWLVLDRFPVSHRLRLPPRPRSPRSSPPPLQPTAPPEPTSPPQPGPAPDRAGRPLTARAGP